MMTKEELIRELNKTGSPTKTAKNIGYSKITVHVWMKKWGITKKIKYG